MRLSASGGIEADEAGTGWARWVHRSRLARVAGVASTVGSRLAAKALGFVLIVLIARFVTPEEFVAYSYLVALALTLQVLTDTGVGLIAGRELAGGRGSAAGLYRAGALPVAAASALGAVLLLGFGLVDNGPGTGGWPLIWMTVFVFLTGVFGLQCNLIRGSGRLTLEAGIQLSGSVLLVVAGVTVVLLGGGLTVLMATLAAKQLLMVVACQAVLPSPFGGERFSGGSWLLLRKGILVGVATTLLVIATRVSLVVVSNVAPTSEAADYAVSFRFFELEFMLSQTVGFALLPLMARWFGEDMRAATRQVWRLVLLAAVVTTVLAGIGLLVAPALVTTVFGDGYAGAAASTRILVCVFPILSVYMLVWFAMAAAVRERAVLALAAVTLAAGVPATCLLLLSSGAVSAAWSVLATFAAGAVAGIALFARATRS